NEVVEQGTPEGVEIAAMLAGYVRQLDPTRPVIQAAHPGTNPWENMDANFAQVDVAGYNYKQDRYGPDHQRVPDRVIIGTDSFPGRCFEAVTATLDMP
ncbi:MAG: beta-galactosidase, partial [Armatimonadetes bacterium]|nr:beta-galactosidase [Armatimonadota bacterium]